MLDELLGKVRQDGLVVQEMVSDKDTFINATFCRYFPEGNSHILLQPPREDLAQKFGKNKKEQV